MFTKDFLNLISDFGDEWVITSIDTDFKNKRVDVHLKYGDTKYFDPDTEAEASYYDLAPERQWRHLDIWDYKCYIHCRLPRVKCLDGKVKTIRMGWADKHDRHTYSFEIKVINTLLASKNQTKTAELLGCSFRMVNRIMHRSTDRGLLNRDLEKLPVRHISIDEKSYQHGHRYITVISHPKSGCVIDVGENRDGASVNKLFSNTFTTSQLEGMLTVSMDMWKAYINTVQTAMPNAEIVHDKFHIIKYLNEAIDKIRRREVKQNEVLKNSRYALLKNPENRTANQKETMLAVLQSNLEVAKAYHAKEAFKTLFDLTHCQDAAKQNLIDWAGGFFKYNIKELNKTILTLLNHSKGVINALIAKINNAMAERLNGKIQEIKLSSRGYRTFKNFRSAILFFHGGLNLFPLKW